MSPKEEAVKKIFAIIKRKAKQSEAARSKAARELFAEKLKLQSWPDVPALPLPTSMLLVQIGLEDIFDEGTKGAAYDGKTRSSWSIEIEKLLEKVKQGQGTLNKGLSVARRKQRAKDGDLALIDLIRLDPRALASPLVIAKIVRWKGIVASSHVRWVGSVAEQKVENDKILNATKCLKQVAGAIMQSTGTTSKFHDDPQMLYDAYLDCLGSLGELLHRHSVRFAKAMMKAEIDEARLIEALRQRIDRCKDIEIVAIHESVIAKSIKVERVNEEFARRLFCNPEKIRNYAKMLVGKQCRPKPLEPARLDQLWRKAGLGHRKQKSQASGTTPKKRKKTK